jgi:hypothetical protein
MRHDSEEKKIDDSSTSKAAKATDDNMGVYSME